MGEKEEKIIRIKELESQIKNCEYDLNGIFKDSRQIINKLRVLKEQLEELKKQI